MEQLSDCRVSFRVSRRAPLMFCSTRFLTREIKSLSTWSLCGLGARDCTSNVHTPSQKIIRIKTKILPNCELTVNLCWQAWCDFARCWVLHTRDKLNKLWHRYAGSFLSPNFLLLSLDHTHTNNDNANKLQQCHVCNKHTSTQQGF